MEVTEPEQLSLFTETVEHTIEVSYVEGGEVFIRLSTPKSELVTLSKLIGMLQSAGAEFPTWEMDRHSRIYGKLNGQLIVIQVLSSHKYIYPFDFTKPESESA